jgi:hypothetical protein
MKVGDIVKYSFVNWYEVGIIVHIMEVNWIPMATILWDAGHMTNELMDMLEVINEGGQSCET